MVTRWLARAPTWVFTAWAVTAAFATYFCMYAFRKPFAVGTYSGTVEVVGAHLDWKTLFIIAQVIGYAASKFLGIKVVSELDPARRARAILVTIGFAEVALVGFALVPPPWNAACLVLNGLPLGMVWGLVFGFIEGRRVSDLLGAGLCVSFIVASGFVKTAGRWVLDAGVGELWMPAVTGGLFLVPLAGFTWMLAQLPPPTAEDEAARTRREPMDARSRRAFFARYAPGLLALVLAYVALSAYRDFRDNYARELWDALGWGDQPAILTAAEVPVALGATLAVAAIMLVRDNDRALLVIHGMLALGAALLVGSTALHAAGRLDPAAWMITVGLGLYVAYVPFNCVLFDRLIAAVGSVGTAGFLIYVADAFGYLGSVLLLLYRNLGQADLPWLAFFEGFSYAVGGLCLLLFAASAAYFHARARPVFA